MYKNIVSCQIVNKSQNDKLRFFFIRISESGIKGCLHEHFHEEVTNILEKEFMCYNVIRQWIRNKTERSNMIKEIRIGQTYEKRDIFVLQLSSGKKKKAVFLMGGEEGRDWTSPAMLLYLIEYILDKTNDFEILMKHYDFYIMPIFNPDGYTYSMMKVGLCEEKIFTVYILN